jgi:hypothetical protein
VQKGRTRVEQQCNNAKHTSAAAFVHAYVHLKIVDTRVRDARMTGCCFQCHCHAMFLYYY